MSTAVTPASLLDRKLEAGFRVLVDALSAAGQEIIVGWMLANAKTVKTAIATVILPGSAEKVAVDWQRIPIVVEPDEWTQANRRDANLKALIALEEATGEAVGHVTVKAVQEAARKLRGRDEDAYTKARAEVSRFSGWGGVAVTEGDVKKLVKALSELGGDPKSLPHRWRNVLDEYYTPTWFGSATWKLIARLHDLGYLPCTPQALEPSAGLGRFVHTAPDGIDWTAVELSPRSAEMLGFMRPEMQVVAPLSFQQFMGKFPPPAEGDFDLVVANPPYGSNTDLKSDRLTGYRRGNKIEVPDGLVNYFLLASARRLRPGGIMVQLVPQGVAKGEKETKVRAQLCRMCHWLAAWAPPMDMFPGSRMGLALVVLRKRPFELASVLAEDEHIVDGRYFESTGKAHISGEWASDVADREGKDLYREGAVGDFDLDPFLNMSLRPMATAQEAAEIGAVAAPADRKKRAKKAPKTFDTPPEAKRLGERLINWRLLRQSHPEIASNGLDELAGDLENFAEEFGNPHETKLRDDQSPEATAVLSAFHEDGTLAPEYVSLDLARTGFSGDPSSLQEVVAYFSGRLGKARWSRVLEVFTGPKRVIDALAQLESDAPVNVLWDVDPTLWADREYLTGSLYGRIDDMISSEEEKIPGPIAKRYEVQRAKLTEAIEPMPMDAIDLNPRSPLISEEAISAFLTHINKSKVTVKRVDTLIELQGETAPNFETYSWISYLNEKSTVELGSAQSRKQEKNKLPGQRSKRHKGKTMREHIKEDERRVEDFLSWLRASAYADEVADAYNRRIKGYRPRQEDGADLGLARVGPAMRNEDGSTRLYPHQNSVVKKLTEARSGIIAHDVGLGKTFSALALVAYWRQLGKSKRPVIAVPKQVQLNWLRECQTLLPDFRVIIIGQHWTGKKWITRNSAPHKDRQWADYAAGKYDLAICTKEQVIELPLDPDHRLEMLRQIPQLRRQEQEEEQEIKRLERAVAAAKQDLQDYLELPPYEQNDKGVEKRDKNIDKLYEQLMLLKDPVGYYTEKIKQVREEIGSIKRSNNPDLELVDVTVAGKVEEKTVAEALAYLEARVAKLQRDKANAEKGGNIRILEQAEAEAELFVEGIEPERKSKLTIRWEEIACDLLVVDEAHNFKNLFKPESVYGSTVKFLGGGSSKRADKACKSCFLLFERAAWVRKVADESGIVLLTATPVTNSPLELYNLLFYCVPHVLEQRGLSNPMDFVNRFCTINQQITIDTKGNPRETPVVSAFGNLDELRYLLDLYTDVKNVDDSPTLKVPENEQINVYLDMNEQQEILYRFLRFSVDEALRNGNGGVLLKLLHEMSDVALDPSMLAADPKRWEETFIGEHGSERDHEAVFASREIVPPKYVECAKRVMSAPACAHIIFLDRKRAHDTLEDAMVDAGVPRDRIARVTGDVEVPDRQRITDRLNGTYEVNEDGEKVLVKPPELDVVIGTMAMAEGMNLQVRGCSIHHVNLPWTSAAIQQRNGRAVRQGNLWALEAKAPVAVYYYMTEKSFDGYKLQAVMGKAGWTETLFRSSSKAANNPLAEAGFDPLQLIDLFSENPEEMRAVVLERIRKMRVEQAESEQDDTVRRIGQYVGTLQSAREEQDAAKADAYRRGAEAQRKALERLPDHIFAEKEILDLAKDVTLAWWPGEVKMNEDFEVVSGPESWIVEGSPVAEYSSMEVGEGALKEAPKATDQFAVRVNPRRKVVEATEGEYPLRMVVDFASVKAKTRFGVVFRPTANYDVDERQRLTGIKLTAMLTRRGGYIGAADTRFNDWIERLAEDVMDWWPGEVRGVLNDYLRVWASGGENPRAVPFFSEKDGNRKIAVLLAGSHLPQRDLTMLLPTKANLAFFLEQRSDSTLREPGKEDRPLTQDVWRHVIRKYFGAIPPRPEKDRGEQANPPRRRVHAQRVMVGQYRRAR